MVTYSYKVLITKHSNPNNLGCMDSRFATMLSGWQKGGNFCQGWVGVGWMAMGQR